MVRSNVVLAYILLVGLPGLGLFLILEAGSNLVPPPAVAGEWDLGLDATTPATQACLGPVNRAQRSVLTISQSGADVSMSLNQAQKIAMAGELKGDHLVGIGVGPLTGDCGHRTVLRLAATVGGKPGQHSLEGQFFLDGCASCAPVAFRAVRQVPLRKPGP